MRLLFRVSALIGVLTLINCYSGNPSMDSKTHVFTVKQKCPTLFEMKIGQSLMFHAAENTSTGYSWVVDKPLTLFQIEQYEQKPKHLAQTQQSILGRSTEKIYQFKALQAGEEVIELFYVRAWEKNSKPMGSWFCHIKVI